MSTTSPRFSMTLPSAASDARRLGAAARRDGHDGARGAVGARRDDRGAARRAEIEVRRDLGRQARLPEQHVAQPRGIDGQRHGLRDERRAVRQQAIERGDRDRRELERRAPRPRANSLTGRPPARARREPAPRPRPRVFGGGAALARAGAHQHGRRSQRQREAAGDRLERRLDPLTRPARRFGMAREDTAT